MKDLRNEKGWSQKELADHSNLERAYISRLERAIAQPSLTTIIKIADALNIRASKILDEIEKIRTDN